MLTLTGRQIITHTSRRQPDLEGATLFPFFFFFFPEDDTNQQTMSCAPRPTPKVNVGTGVFPLSASHSERSPGVTLRSCVPLGLR